MVERILCVLLAALAVWAVRRTALRFRKGGGCCGEHEAIVRRVPIRDRNRAHYPYQTELDIGGMTCENCARRVENALNALDGVWAQVDMGSHRARVRLKAPPDSAALSRAVAEAGYVVLERKESF